MPGKLGTSTQPLYARQQVCAKFLLTVKDHKQATILINNIKDKQSLAEHLSLIADACSLLPEELSTEIFLHLKALVANKKLNKVMPLKKLIDVMPLKKLIDFDFSCSCIQCKSILYKEQIPRISNKLNLATHSLPESQVYLKSQTTKAVSTLPVLSQADPFKILSVAHNSTKAVMMQQVLQLIRQFPEQMAVIRQAQSELFEPAQRFLHHYLRYFAKEELNLAVEPIYQDVTSPLEQIPLRQEFLNAK